MAGVYQCTANRAFDLTADLLQQMREGDDAMKVPV